MIIQTEIITKSPDELLAGLEQKTWYMPALARMGVKRQREWLAVRVLLKKMLGTEKQILYTDFGKPYLADASYRISISHTKKRVAIALAENNPIAIDIEEISPRVENIRSRFMNETEELYLSKIHPLIHSLLHWSAKEAIYKYMDGGDIDFKSQLHIHPFEPVMGEWKEFTAHETRTKQQQNFVIRYMVNEDYVLCMINS